MRAIFRINNLRGWFFSGNQIDEGGFILLNMTIIDFLTDRANRNADDIAFRFLANGELDGPIIEWTFSELFRQSAGVAQDLFDRGHTGTSILLAFPPGLDFVKAFFGCMMAGIRAVPVPLPNPNSKNPLGRILATAAGCEATIVMTTKELADMVGPMMKDLPITLEAVTEKTQSKWDGPETKMDQVAYLQFTSGSTGHPKGVAITHANAVANLRVMGQMLRLKASQPAMVWAPHYHDLCLVGHILGPVMFGYESILMSPLEFLMKPVRWLKAMSHYKVANTACPNFGYEYSVRRVKPEDCEGLDLSNWRIAGNGGEPVLKPTLDAFVEKFGPHGFKREAFMPCYGMAESVLFVAGLKSMSEAPKVLTVSSDDLETHKITILPDNPEGERTVVSCGAPASEHRVISVDPVERTLNTPDQVGELWVQGPSVPACYWGLKEETEATFEGYLADSEEGRFLRTGDLGFVKDDEVYITGRIKDLIIIAGKNHYPSDIEFSIQNSGAPIRTGSCVAVSQEVNGAEELVIITEVDDKKIPEDDQGEAAVSEFWTSAVKKIQGAVSEGHKLSAQTVVFVKPRSLEKTSSGKPRRRYYKQLFQKGELDLVYEKRPLKIA